MAVNAEFSGFFIEHWSAACPRDFPCLSVVSTSTAQNIAASKSTDHRITLAIVGAGDVQFWIWFTVIRAWFQIHHVIRFRLSPGNQC